MELKEVVRKLRAGETVEGAAIWGNILYFGGKNYQVQGQARLRIVEIQPGTVTPELEQVQPETREKVPRKPKERDWTPAKNVEGICSKCGGTFVKSKYNPYFTECPSCRKRDRSTGSEDREFTCQECGGVFIISKFQPYLIPVKCPACNRKATARRAKEAMKARKAAERG